MVTLAQLESAVAADDGSAAAPERGAIAAATERVQAKLSRDERLQKLQEMVAADDADLAGASAMDDALHVAKLVGSGAVRGVAGTVDLIRWIATGTDVTEAIRRAEVAKAKRMGIEPNPLHLLPSTLAGVVEPALTKPGDSLTERALAYIGESVGASVLPNLGLFKLAKGIKDVQAARGLFPILGKEGEALVARVARAPGRLVGAGMVGAAQAAKQTPKMFLAGEVASATGAGAGRAVAEEAGLGPVGQSVAQVAGGMAATAVPATLVAAKRMLGQFFRPLTPGGRAAEAAAAVQRAATGTPAEIAAKLEAPAPTSAPLTSGMMSDDPGLMSLERAVIGKNAVLRGRFLESERAINRHLREEMEAVLGGGAPPQAVVDFVEGDVSQLKSLMQARVQQAGEAARAALSRVTGTLSKADASRLVRGEIEQAFRDARVQESKLYSAIDRKAIINYQPLRDALGEIRRDSKAWTAMRNLPSKDITQFIDPPAPKTIPDFAAISAAYETGAAQKAIEDPLTRLQNIQSLRSEILRMIRAERSRGAPRAALIGNLEKLQKAALDSIETTAAQTADQSVAAQLRAARDFSVSLHDTFTRGPVGDILGFTVAGGKRIYDVETLDRLVRTGPMGGESADAMLMNTMRQAMEKSGAKFNDPDSIKFATREYLYRQFAEQAVDGSGKVNPEATRRFVQRYDEVLRRFPDVRDGLMNSAQAQTIADGAIAAERVAIDDLRKNRVYLFLDEAPQKVIAGIFNDRNPARAMRAAAEKLAQDKSGAAEEGFKRLIADYMIGSSGLARVLEHDADTAVHQLSAAKMEKVIKGNMGALRASNLYTAQQLKHLENILAARQWAERVINSRIPTMSDTATIAGTTPLRALVGGYAGAAIGSAISSGSAHSLRTVGIMAGVGKRLFGDLGQQQIDQLITEAVFDPKLMALLLTKPTPATLPIWQRQLRGHLVNLQILDPTTGEE